MLGTMLRNSILFELPHQYHYHPVGLNIQLVNHHYCPDNYMSVAIGLVNFVLNLPDRQELFFFLGNSNYRRTVINPANQKGFWGYLK